MSVRVRIQWHYGDGTERSHPSLVQSCTLNPRFDELNLTENAQERIRALYPDVDFYPTLQAALKSQEQSTGTSLL